MELNRGESLAELSEGIEHDLQAMVEPLKGRLANVDELMRERLSDLETLRKARRQIVTALRAFVREEDIPDSPLYKTKPGPKKTPARPSHTRVAQERIDRALEWARAQNGSGGWTTKEMREGLSTEGYVVSRSSGEAVIRALREREQVRVVSPNRGPLNPARFVAVMPDE